MLEKSSKFAISVYSYNELLHMSGLLSFNLREGDKGWGKAAKLVY